MCCRPRSLRAQSLTGACWSITASGWCASASRSTARCSGICTTSGPSSSCPPARCSTATGARVSPVGWRAPSRQCAFASPATNCVASAKLTQTINALEAEIAQLVARIAPQLLSEPGLGPLTAAKLVGEIAGAARFASDAKLARAAGVAPIPVSSGNTNRHRLDRGGNRQINAAIHRIAVTRTRCHPETRAYIARKRPEGKTTKEAIRCLKRHLARRVWHLLQTTSPNQNQAINTSIS
jgi:Transposase IS116/IS110/IS902 family